ncbi:MAG: TonB-dependent receptor plug domain-containing protein [Alphaproteobacteria bacterium]|nr:TonB-dependent receptor plug domain-containing protein [Alphaproteobacteria bacterium]
MHKRRHRSRRIVPTGSSGLCRLLSRQAALAGGALGIAGTAIIAGGASAQTVESLQQLSIEDLSNLEITSVSKWPQSVARAPAAIYVISHDEIVRSGARTIPEMLRLAPNLFVAQTSPSNYVITPRGLNGNNAAQNFPNKLLVLIDGRSVYNPLFSGMYWDMQDVMPEDIDRIEVISGPGASLWGANAVNGVINIVTRESSLTQGGVVELAAGNQGRSVSARYGGRLSDTLTYRVYAKAFRWRAFENQDGNSSGDGWEKPQGGFRVDWRPEGDQVTLQGDFYDGAEDRPGLPDLQITGGNIQAHWQHDFKDGSTLQLLAYYDRVQRHSNDGNGGFTLDTYNLEMQHNFSIGGWNEIVWGVGERISAYTIRPEAGPGTELLFDPASRHLHLTNVFLQDRVSLGDRFDVTLGIKLEFDSYSGLTPMPSIRARWRPNASTMFWAAVSRAVRSPTPFDTNVIEKLGGVVFVKGNPDFRTEKLTSYELGYRGQLSSRLLLSVSGFYSDYDDLRTIELSPAGGLPLQWGNMMEGHIYGVEIWGTYQAADWWRLSAGLTLQKVDLAFKPGSVEILDTTQAGDDPPRQASLRSSMNLGDGLSFDADLRYVARLPNPRVPGYVELNARLAWDVTDRLQLSVSGQNLLHARHQEYTAPPSDQVERSFLIATRWTF